MNLLTLFFGKKVNIRYTHSLIASVDFFITTENGEGLNAKLGGKNEKRFYRIDDDKNEIPKKNNKKIK
jgi:hypothetical protein